MCNGTTSEGRSLGNAATDRRKLRNSLGGKRMLTGTGDVTISQEKTHFSASKAKYWRAFLNLK
jgi:hypothetical protein